MMQARVSLSRILGELLPEELATPSPQGLCTASESILERLRGHVLKSGTYVGTLEGNIMLCH